MYHPITIYYIAHNDIPEDFTLRDPFSSDEAHSLLVSSGGTMRTAGRRQSRKYILRKYASHFLLNRIYGITSSAQLKSGPHGKPAFADSFHPDTPFPCFNLSHGKDYTVLAVSDAALGVDIQELPEENSAAGREKGKQRRILVADRSFPQAYRTAYLSASPEDEAIVFTRLWTQTEAILKAEGTGFALDLREHPELLSRWRLQNFRIDGHEITVAMQGPFIAELKRIFITGGNKNV